MGALKTAALLLRGVYKSPLSQGNSQKERVGICTHFTAAMWPAEDELEMSIEHLLSIYVASSYPYYCAVSLTQPQYQIP